MTDRVYPSSKPNGTTKPTTTRNQRLPPPPAAAAPNKPQLHNPTTTTTTRHPYRPNPTTNHHPRHRHRRRRCFCLCCFWSILVTILLLLLATIAGCIFYLLYHPHRPTFSIAAVKLAEFTLATATDDTTRLTSKLNLTISTTNPNKKITFYYDSITITCLSEETLIAKGFFPNPLISNPNNITVIHSSLHSNSMLLDTDTVRKITSDLKKRKKSGLPLKLLLDTEARVKIESLRTKKVGIRIKCEGIHSLIPKHSGKNSSSSMVVADVSGAKCKVDLRIKIWKWSF